MRRLLHIALFMIAILAMGNSYAQQAPVVSYPDVPSFKVGTPITTLVPIQAGGAVPANAFGQLTVFAGNGSAGYINANGTSAAFRKPHDVRLDAAGNLYVADANNHAIRKITPNGDVSTFAGSLTGVSGSADGAGPLAGFYGPTGLAFDAAGNLFVADQLNHTIRKITPLSVVTTIAGKAGSTGYTNAQGSFARFYLPTSLTVDKNGGLYVADLGNRVIRHVGQDGSTATIAGDGRDTSYDARGTKASFTNPSAVLKDVNSSLIYVTDISHIRTIDNDDNVVTVAGGFFSGVFDGFGKGALLSTPVGLTMSKAGVIFFSDAFSARIRRFDPSGEIKTMTTTGFTKPAGLDVDKDGTLYIADEDANVIRKMPTTGYTISPALPPGLTFDQTTGIISGTPTQKLASTSYTLTAYNIYGKSVYGFYIEVREAVLKPQALSFGPISDKTMGDPDFDPGAKATLPSPLPISYKSSDLNIAVISNGRVLLRGPGKVTIWAFQEGNIDYADADSLSQTFEVNPAPELDKPIVTAKPGPLVFKLDKFGHLTLKATDLASIEPGSQTPTDALVTSIKPDSIFTCEDIGPQTLTVAAGYGPDPADPLNAQFNGPARISADRFGNLFVADQGFYKVRKIDIERRVFTLAGSISGFADGKGNNARFARAILAIANDYDGNIFVCDVYNNALRKITPDSVTTRFAYTELPAANGGTFTPVAVAADKDNYVYVANQTKIFKISPDGKTVTLFAGSQASANTDGVGPTATFSGIAGLTFDSKGDLYVTTSSSIGNTLRKISASGVSYTIYSVPYAANFTQPVVDSHGDIFIASSSPVIYKITQKGEFSIYAGGQVGYANGSRLSAKFDNPQGIAIDANDILYITDSGNKRIRMITPAGKVSTLAGNSEHGDRDNSYKSNATKVTVPIIIQSPLGLLDTYNNLEVPVAPNCTGSIANFAAEAHPSSPCANSSTVTQTPAPGTTFVVGQMVRVTLHVSDNTGQSVDIPFEVTGVPVPPPAVTVAIKSGAQCNGLPITFKATPQNEGKTATYKWTVNGVAQPGDEDMFTYSKPADKDKIACVVTNNDYCSPLVSQPGEFTINTQPAINVALTITPSITEAICPGVSITFTATTSGMPVTVAAAPVYHWKVNGVEKGTNNVNFRTNALRDGDVVTCEMESMVECATNPIVPSNEIKIAVKTETECGITVPTAFTPNADGNNDMWEIPALIDFPDCNFSIFNRYGKQVFHSVGYAKPWDGNYNGKKLAAGTYYYMIDLKTGRPPLSGSVTILR